jgi:hypothetical protein
LEGQHRSKYRFAATGFVLLSLLIPYGFGFLSLAGSEKPDCGMECHRRSKDCCCRRSETHAHQEGPGWGAPAKCPKGCAQLPAVSGTVTALLTAARVEVSPVVVVSQTQIPAVAARRSPETGFALFERPPPTT